MDDGHDAVRVLFVDYGGVGTTVRAAVHEIDGISIEATDGADVLKRLDHEDVDIVILPESLPDLPVDVVCRRLVVDRGEHPPIVIGEVVGAPMIQCPADVSVSDLADRIERAYRKRRLGQAVERHERVERALIRVADEVVDASTPTAALQRLADELRSVGAYRYILVGKCTPGADSIDVAEPIHRSLSPEELASLLGALDRSFVASALESGDVTVANVSDNGSSLVAIPLSIGGRARGIVVVGTDPDEAPDGSERALLARIGRLGGLALGRVAAEDPDIDRGRAIVRMLNHEIRNILQAATLSLSSAREEGDPEALDSLEEALQSIESVLGAGMELASGDTVASTQPVDIEARAEKVWRTIRTPGAELDIVKPVTVEADPTLVERLLTNLLSNAVDHGGSEVTVRIGGLSTGGFYVEDDGSGIPFNERDAIFEWGYTTSERGMGVGLSIVKSITDAHEWSLSVSSSTDGGARFEVKTDESNSTETDRNGGYAGRETGFIFGG